MSLVGEDGVLEGKEINTPRSNVGGVVRDCCGNGTWTTWHITTQHNTQQPYYFQMPAAARDRYHRLTVHPIF